MTEIIYALKKRVRKSRAQSALANPLLAGIDDFCHKPGYKYNF
jgi:hypothetical protein